MRKVIGAMVVALAAACASPQTARPTLETGEIAAEQNRQALFVLEQRAGEYQRIYAIAERLYRANLEFCHRTSPAIGVRVENLHDYPREFRAAASNLWGLSDQPSVLWVAEDSPAATAGLRARDRILSVNGRAVRTGRQATRHTNGLLRDAADEGPVALQVARGSETLSLTVTPQQSCAYQFYVVDDDAINAAADGRTIYLNRGMLRFAQSDEELALILGHELAHNAMRHIEKAQTNAMMGTIGGALLDIAAAAGGVNTGGAFADAGGDLGRMMFSQEFESEADYVGLYFSARAGYDINNVEQFWRRMAAENPRSIRFAYTHPNTAERFLGIAAARNEIALKLSNGQSLRPNMEGDAAPSPSAPPAAAQQQQQPETVEGQAPSPPPPTQDEPAGEAMSSTPG